MRKARDLGYDEAERNGMSSQLLGFEGRIGAGYNFWDLESYVKWFGAIFKSHFAGAFPFITWKDLGVPSEFYGMESMMMEINGTGVRFDLKKIADDKFREFFTHSSSSKGQNEIFKPIKLTVTSDSYFADVIKAYITQLNRMFETVPLKEPDLQGHHRVIVFCPRIDEAQVALPSGNGEGNLIK